MRVFIELKYRGTNYCGWQIQPNGITVQDEIQKALSTIFRTDIEIVGAGRTDAGVHAKYMVAHSDFPDNTSDFNVIVRRLNSILPKDISIINIKEQHADAHARFDAIAREYKYYLTFEKDPFGYDLVYKHIGTLDFNLMNEAAKSLFDYIDFTSFSKLHTDVKTNNCKIYHAKWEQEGNKWVFTISADRFLRNMVRAIVGTLIEVGRKKLSLEQFREIIELKNRCKAGTSVPGCGLYLTDIKYPY